MEDPTTGLTQRIAPYEKQIEVIRELFSQPDGQVKLVDLCCGRGFGKTTLACMVAQMMLNSGPNQDGLFLEPDVATIDDSFLTEWERITPPRLYELNYGRRMIIWKSTGSRLSFGPRMVSGSQKRAKNKYRGRNRTFVIDDEAADTFIKEMYTNILACIRTPSPYRFYFTCSTPRVGPYSEMITSAGHKMIRGTSYDNPHLDRGLIDLWKDEMSGAQFRREVLAELVSLEGRIWNEFNDQALWPYGNVWPGGFDANKPWHLFCDLGSATGSYVVIQRHDPRASDGRELFRGDVWVAKADLCPQSDGSATRAFEMLRNRFGIPASVTAGADINTRGSGEGKSIAYFAKQMFGDNIRINPVSECWADKRIQHDLLLFLIRSGKGNRRFAIADSEHYQELDADSKRGVRQVMVQDQWPEEEEKNPAHFLPKNKECRVQHCRDALLMGAVSTMAPPSWGSKIDVAK